MKPSHRQILVYGNEKLVAPTVRVRDFDDTLRALIDEMFMTGWRAPGLGLAAPQIGVNLKLAVIDPSIGKNPMDKLVLANPEIIESEGHATLDEGCLSFPGLYTKIERPKRVIVRAQDQDGEEFELEATEVLAQAICHEIDHINSILIIDHLRGLKRHMFLRKIKKAREIGLWR